MNITIYHNPRCSKSRQTLSLLRERGIEPTVVEYLTSPPDNTTLAHLLDLLGMEPRELMRTEEPQYKESGLDDPNLTREQLIDAMVAHPHLIQRPIVVRDQRAVLGRPPERILDII